MATTRLFWIKLITIALPLLVLALIEGGLRLSGYGFSTQLFIEDEKNPGYLIFNPDVSKRYFARHENATVGNYEPFTRKKDANTFRIIVLGESTTVGYPYLHNGSFHRWLHYRLQHSFPRRPIEVINLSLTAVNSYTVRDFADELAEANPDAVLIYVGHNEYYGALGVSSSSFLGSNPALVMAAVKARKLKIVQWISDLTNALGADPVGENVTLMQRMSDKNQVAYRSARYRAGLRQFSTNIMETFSALQKLNVPVFIGTVFSNEKDLSPFISASDGAQESALDYFKKGQRAYLNGAFSEAKSAFDEARNLDLLRFRAPDTINHIIRAAAALFEHVSVVNVKERLEQESPGGIIGEEMLWEHVHPNLFGYACMSDAFFNALRAATVISSDWSHALSFDSLLVRMPVTRVDSLAGAYEILMLREQWPFYEEIPPDTNTVKAFEEQLAGAIAVKQLSWGEGMLRLLRHYQHTGAVRQAMRVGEALALDNAHQSAAAAQVASLAKDAGQVDLAVHYWQRSFMLKQDFPIARALFIELLKQNRPEEALPFLEFAMLNNQGGVELRELYGWVNAIVEARKNLTGNPSDIPLLLEIARLYLRFANVEAARSCLQQAHRLNPSDKSVVEVLNEMEMNPG